MAKTVTKTYTAAPRNECQFLFYLGTEQDGSRALHVEVKMPRDVDDGTRDEVRRDYNLSAALSGAQLTALATLFTAIYDRAKTDEGL